jgi:hypothetical protein
METSPSEPVPPEVIAIAVALAATLLEPGSDEPPAPPDVDRWRWQAWDG